MHFLIKFVFALNLGHVTKLSIFMTVSTIIVKCHVQCKLRLCKIFWDWVFLLTEHMVFCRKLNLLSQRLHAFGLKVLWIAGNFFGDLNDFECVSMYFVTYAAMLQRYCQKLCTYWCKQICLSFCLCK